MTIKLKLAAAFGVVIALSAISGVVAYSKLAAVNESLDFVVNGFAKRAQLADELRTHMLLDIRAEKNMLLSSSDADTAQLSQTKSCRSERRPRPPSTPFTPCDRGRQTHPGQARRGHDAAE